MFVSNGPGDPTMCTPTIRSLQWLMRKAEEDGEKPVPIFGICLGNQLLALAAGAKVIIWVRVWLSIAVVRFRPHSKASTSDGLFTCDDLPLMVCSPLMVLRPPQYTERIKTRAYCKYLREAYLWTTRYAVGNLLLTPAGQGGLDWGRELGWMGCYTSPLYSMRRNLPHQ